MKKLFTSLIFVAQLTLVLGLVLGFQPLLAQTVSPGSNGGADNVYVSTDTSKNWAGYIATNGPYTSVSGTWIVPTVDTNSSPLSADATWVGLGGVQEDDLIQAGTHAMTDVHGAISYQAWYEVLPDASISVPLTIHPGDSITTSINFIQEQTWYISILNNTTGQNFGTYVQYSSTMSSAEWIEEMPSAEVSNGIKTVNGYLPLNNFGKAIFVSGTTVQNGQTLSIIQTGAQPITMVNNSRRALATVSPLESNGQGFTVYRTNALSDSTVAAQFGVGQEQPANVPVPVAVTVPVTPIPSPTPESGYRVTEPVYKTFRIGNYIFRVATYTMYL